jgi:Rab GDP dissociation inhibitor
VALYQEESYVDKPAIDLVERMQLYKRSLLRFVGLGSPYMYPLYGLGELPQSFARLAAVYGGTYMLNRDIDHIVYDDAGKTVGVSAQGVVAKSPVVIGDPSYFSGKTKKVGKVVRALAIISHPLEGTGGCGSCQIIFPQNQVGRKNDVYLFCINNLHKVAAPGTWIAFASTKVENPVDGMTVEQVAKRELAACLGFLEPTLEIFYDMYDLEEPLSDGKDDNVYISKSYDETSHFETAITDVIELYTRYTPTPFLLTIYKYHSHRRTFPYLPAYRFPYSS